MLREFQRVGRQLLQLGLITSHGGNASVRKGDYVYITCHMAMLGDLEKGNVVKVSFSHKDPSKTANVSKEYSVHREIYETTGADAVIHAHPVHAVALSLVREVIKPLDAEGMTMVGDVPVIATCEVAEAVGNRQVAKAVAEALKKWRVVMVKGHGSFAVGKTLEEALCYTSALEDSSKIILTLGKQR
ncbi:MAG: class II aldolase/adducin family protein [Candidatus Brocadiales bacterium]